MIEEIDSIVENAMVAIGEAESLREVNALSVRYLGRKGLLTSALRKISSLPLEVRPLAGKFGNEAKNKIRLALNAAVLRTSVEEHGFDDLDVSLPGRKYRRGFLHPITQVLSDICDVFVNMGFEIVEGSEVETDYYNFEALNLPKNHPARDMQDTFYVSDEILLRTHTSSSQPRIMEERKPPIAIIVPGKVYRCDSDITHTPMFHQVEGLFVDCDVSFGDLKGIISAFIQQLFGRRTKIRFRPSFFPFTEPSAEVDIACVICENKGCRVCSQTGWVEILGSGMVHPSVFEKVGYDISRYTGIAFGMGVERIAMLKYRVDDIRKYFDSDFRFLSQF